MSCKGTNTTINERWTVARIAHLRQLHGAGKSRGEIAALLGCGFTRNAVIGKLLRLGLGERREPRGPKQPRHYGPKRRSENYDGNGHFDLAKLENLKLKTVVPGKPEPPPPHGSKTLMEIGLHECRFPYGNKTPYMFCSQPTEEGHSYCPGHEQIVYQPLMGLRA